MENALICYWIAFVYANYDVKRPDMHSHEWPLKNPNIIVIIGANQGLRNAVGGCQFSRKKSVTKVMLLVSRGGGWVSIFHKKAISNTWIAPYWNVNATISVVSALRTALGPPSLFRSSRSCWWRDRCTPYTRTDSDRSQLRSAAYTGRAGGGGVSPCRGRGYWSQRRRRCRPASKQSLLPRSPPGCRRRRPSDLWARETIAL